MNLRAPGSRLAGTNIPVKIVWPRQGLISANAAMDQLFEIFPDKYPILLNESEEDWTFRLSWPRHLLEPIDPALWEQAQDCYGLELSQVADYWEVRRYGRVDFVFSMFHSWALLAPAIAATRRGGKPLRWVIHVDAHHDLGASLLRAVAPAVLNNACFEIECRLDDPESISRCIDCGLIHKGSYLTAFCLGTSPGHLYQISPDDSPGRFWLHPVVGSVQIGGTLAPRDSVTFQHTPSAVAWEISESSILPQILPMEAMDGIWLDVDLDAFCNRFDGDSDRRDNPKRAGEVSAMQLAIATFLDSLSKASWLPYVEAVSVAASPGFFPSEYWEHAIPTVCEGIAKALSK